MTARKNRAVSRAEFDLLREQVDQSRRDLRVQFTRIAQIQAELDRIRSAWTRSLARESKDKRKR